MIENQPNKYDHLGGWKSHECPTINTSRIVEPEILDGLSQDSSAARASRRDLRIINRLLGSEAWLENVLQINRRSGESVLEVGAGTGELGRALSAIVPAVMTAGLDLGRRPLDWPPQALWFETDVLNFTGWADFPIVIGNLFFHHFDHAGLAQLGARLNEHARVIIASDPLRVHRTTTLFSLLCPLIGAHPVTQHDGRVSITAGFRHHELPRLLQLDPSVWRWRVQETWLGSCRLVAERIT
jgi:2-polyprenyl-3-methyl-5-hydroxy-6-metoxy-1,4-benzoquinol methylase